MIDQAQFQIARDLCGYDTAKGQLIATLEELEHVLPVLNDSADMALSHADTLHQHLNTLTALGANVLARQIAEIEMTLRDRGSVLTNAIFVAVTSIEQTRQSFQTIQGATA
ncbi:MAG: hypothetical protein MK098_03180 [Marinovum sp.]|nr:hypothetical protein [Marinovum sp.]